MEIKVDVPAEIWQKFEQMSDDIDKDRNKVFSEIISKAFDEFIIEHPETAEKLGLAKPKQKLTK